MVGSYVGSSSDWHTRAKNSIPGGVSSPVRAFSAVGGTPRYFVRGEGSRVFDIDGAEYVDFVGSWGPMILGHAHPQVVSALQDTVALSTSFGAPHPHEFLLAEEIIDRIDPVERVRFVSSGTEAVMTAVRLARAATGRDLIVKFAGCYHGHLDSLLVEAGSGVATLGMPNSPGIPAGHTRDTVVLPYNDIEALEELFTLRGSEVAVVATEAAPANMGVVPPDSNFVEALYRLAHTHGALVLSDEVMTGFRVSRGGWWAKVDGPAGHIPDLLCFGKVIGGGLPLAAVSGPAHLMNQLAPEGPVYQAGTLSGNPVATRAGLETLRLLDQDVYDHLDSISQQVGDLVHEALTKAGVAHQVQRAGNLLSVFFTDTPVTNFDQARAQDTTAFSRFFHSLLDNGVSLPPSAFEAWFVSAAHSEADLDLLESALPAASQAAASESTGTTKGA